MSCAVSQAQNALMNTGLPESSPSAGPMRPAAPTHAPAAEALGVAERSSTSRRVVDEDEDAASNAARHAASAARVDARVCATARRTASAAFASSGPFPDRGCRCGRARCAPTGAPASSRGPATGARNAARGAAPGFVPRRAAYFRFRPRHEPPAKAKLDGVEMACMVGSYPAQPHAVILRRLQGPRVARPTPDAIRVRRARLEHLTISAVPSTGVRKAREAIVGNAFSVGAS